MPRPIIDLFGLPALGKPGVDHAPSMTARVSEQANLPASSALDATAMHSPAPVPAPKPVPPALWLEPLGQPMPALVANVGKSTPAPNDGVMHAKPPAPHLP